MKLEEKIGGRVKEGSLISPGKSLQDVTKEKIEKVLKQISRDKPDIIDAVFALLDDQTDSFFPTAKNFKFCDGASTAHIACHIGLLQRGSGKLDREGRDLWLKPLWEIGAIEKVSLFSPNEFIAGHPIAKSPNSAYRLTNSLIEILKAPDGKWEPLLREWSRADKARERLEFQAKQAALAKTQVDATHETLINDICEHYAPRFLPDYEILYIDDSDGDRITGKEKAALAEAGITIELNDSMPDVLLWNRKTDVLWVVEAVCSDGEVDLHKKENLKRFAIRHGKTEIGFTTAYRTWKEAAARQKVHKNIAPETYLWIQEDGAKQMLVSDAISGLF